MQNPQTTFSLPTLHAFNTSLPYSNTTLDTPDIAEMELSAFKILPSLVPQPEKSPLEICDIMCAGDTGEVLADQDHGRAD